MWTAVCRPNSLQASLQRLDAPLDCHLVGIPTERRLVELDDGRSHRVQRLRFRVQDFGERHGEGPFVTVVGIDRRIHDRQRTGQGDLDRNRRLVLGQNASPARGAERSAPDGPDALTARREAAPVAGPLLHQIVVVEAFHARGNVRNPGLPALLPVADDVDARRHLVMNGDAHGIVQGLLEDRVRDRPVRAPAVHVLRSLAMHGIPRPSASAAWAGFQPRWSRIRIGHVDSPEKGRGVRFAATGRRAGSRGRRIRPARAPG